MRKRIGTKVWSVILTAAMVFSLAVCAGGQETRAAETEAVEMLAGETAVFDGKEYVKLYTIVCEDSLTTTDSRFDQYFAEGNAADGVAAIVRAGNVYVNGQRIPYMTADGQYSTNEMTVNGEQAIWQVDGGWAWSAHRQRNWDEQFYMPALEAGYDDATPVDLNTAAYLYTKYMAHVVGQTIELYAEPGSNYASVISTKYYNSTLVSGMASANGVTHFLSDDGTDLGIDFPTQNVDPAIREEDMIIYWQDEVNGWTAKRAVPVLGRMVENTDPNDKDANKHPYFLPKGATTTITTGDSYIGKNFGEAFRHTQFIRGERRTNQYAVDADIIMWSSDEGMDHVIGFTRGSSARKSLEYAVAYAETVASEIAVSADGSDVPSDQYWVTPEIWAPYAEKLAEAKAMLAAGGASNIEYDNMIFELGNAFGGGEDLNSTGPMKMNPLGVIGSVAYGTKN